MTTQSLSGVTLQTVANYRRAAMQAVKAYRVGSHRLLGAVDGAIENTVYPRTAKLAPRASERLNAVRGNVSGRVAKGIDQVADFSGKAIERSSTTATAQLGKAAKFAAGIEHPTLASGLQAVSRLSMPGAKMGLVVSGKLAEGAVNLVAVVGGKPAQRMARSVKSKVAATTTKVKTAAKRAAATAKPALARKGATRARRAK